MLGHVYKVGVQIALSGNAAEGIAALATKVTGLGVKVDQLTGKFGRLKLAIGGAAAMWGGEKMIAGMAKMAKYGDKIVEQQAQLRSLGLSAQQVTQATRYSTAVANKVQTTTIAANLKHLGELRYGTGHLNIAEMILPFVSKANAILKDKVGKAAADQIWPMVKSLEMKGELTPQTIPAFKKYVDSMTQAVIATHGKVTPQMFLRNFVYGRTATFGWDLQFMPYLVRAMQSMGTNGGVNGGRSGPGNALMSAFAAIVEQQMPKRAAEMFGALGLANVRGIHGSSQAKLGHVKGEMLFEHNPYEWVQKVLMPALAAHHVAMPQGMNPENLKKMFGSNASMAEAKQRNDIIGVISRMFRNRTASQMISEFALFGSYMEGRNSMYEKDKRMQLQSMKTGKAYKWLMQASPWMRQYVMHAQYENMLEAMGKALVPIQMTVLRGLTRVFNAIANISMHHPELVKALAVGIAALGVALVGAGAAAIFAAIGVGGWFIGGIAGIAAALAMFAGSMTLSQLATGIKAVAAALSIGVLAAALGAGGWLATGIAAIAGALEMVPWKTVLGDISSGIAKLGHALDGFWGKLKSWGSWLGHHIAFYPSPSAVHLTPAVYAAGAGYGGAAAGNIAMPHHFAYGGSHVSHDASKANPTNAYIAHQRARFAAALKQPNMRLKFAAMLMTEGSKHPTMVAESAMNRADYMHWSLSQTLNPHFYGTYSQWPAAERELERNPKLRHRMYAAINRALAGSDTIHGATDQGMVSDPNGHYILHHFHVFGGGNIFGDWGGGHGHAAAQAWRRNFEQHAQNADELPSNALAARHSQQIHVDNMITLDGKVIAKNTLKHVVGMGNMPEQGARLTDPFGAVPSIV